jgi:23S rRNA pseudouridine1911/1915/1917 synthase
VLPNLSQLPTNITIIFEDQYLLALSKPAGVVVNRADSVKVATLQDWVEAYFAQDEAWQAERAGDSIFAERSGMIHRLDKDTSGIILFAKTVAVMQAVMKQFEERQTSKMYTALVHGFLPSATGRVEAPIQRNPAQREVFAVLPDGRPSVTEFAVQQEYSGVDIDRLRTMVDWSSYGETGSHDLVKLTKIYQGFSLVNCWPKTGRTHQIRVHMQFLHHPIVGDERYAGRKRSRLDALWCPRQFLHAAELQITHPVSGEKMTLTAPLPVDLQQALSVLLQK